MVNHVPLSDELEQLRSVALQRSQVQRRRITQAEWESLKWLAVELPPAFQDQIWRDIKTYNFYDALAMWLDPVSGLASYYPQSFVEIGKQFLKPESPEPAPYPSPPKPSIELVEKGISGHIGNYDVFVPDDTIVVVEDWKGGKSYKKTVKGIGDFVKKAGVNLRIGWAKFPDFEVIYIYDISDENFGYAFNFHVPEFSEWGYAPFEIKGAQPAPVGKPERTTEEEIKASAERIEANFIVTYDMKEMARVGTEAQARDLMLQYQKERGWYPPALTTFPIETWSKIQQGSLEGWKQVPMELRPRAKDLEKLILDYLKGTQQVAYGILRTWWQMQKTAYPLEWFEGTLNALQARRLIKRYINRYGVEVVELVVPGPGVTARHGVEITGIPGEPVAKPLREVSGAIDQAGFEQLVFDYMDAAKREWAKREALRKRFEQLADKSNWKLAIPLRKFSNLQEAVETAAAISWFHGGVDFSIIDPSEINVWSKGYYFYTGGA